MGGSSSGPLAAVNPVVWIANAPAILPIEKANKDKKEAKALMAEQKRSTDALLQQGRDQQSKYEKQLADEQAQADGTYKRDSARARQRALAASSSGRRDTILTGPLGLQGPATTANKTLLGA